MNENNENIEVRVKRKEREAADLTKLIELHQNKKCNAIQFQEVQNLELRLRFRLLELEEKGWDAKIEIKKELLRLLQSIK